MFGEAATILEVALILVGGAFIAVAICSRLGLPSIVGYLAAGLLLGPTGTGVLVHSEGISHFAELGVVFLLFTLGLEFSLSKLIELRRGIFGVGLSQVLAVAAIVAAGCVVLLDLRSASAVIVGGAVAMSSTALCLKQLGEQNELDTRPGRVAVAVLLFQDLATAFFLVLLNIAAAGASPADSMVRFGISIATLLFALLLMRMVMRPFTAWVCIPASGDLLQLAALVLALGAAYVAGATGLSPAIGAFLAGMLISESDARHVVEKEIRPFRDLLIGIFFVSVGTQIEVQRAFDAPWQFLCWLTLILVLKFLVLAVIVRASGESRETAVRTATMLAHGGEFGLLLVSLALSQQLLEPALAQPLFVALGVSVLIAPLLIRFNVSVSRTIVGAAQ